MEKLPIIGTDTFNLNKLNVLSARQDRLDRVNGFTKSLSHEDELVRKVAAQQLPIVRAQYAALSQDSAAILSKARAIYDRTVELGRSGLDEETIALKVGNEFPDVVAYYELLRMQDWGYFLVQAVIAARSE